MSCLLFRILSKIKVVHRNYKYSVLNAKHPDRVLGNIEIIYLVVFYFVFKYMQSHNVAKVIFT